MTSRKHLLLYGPLLRLRKIVLYVLIAFIVLGLVLYFVANSPLVIKKLADRFAPDYNISYSNIHGNILTGVEIEDLAYDNASIAQHITLKWNPSGLFRKKIIVHTLQIEKANIDTIKTLIASFENNESNSTETFAFGVGVRHLSLGIEPFVEQGIQISKVALDVKGVEYAGDSVSVDALDLQVDSNITDIRLYASLKEGKVRVKELHIKDVDVLALQSIFLSDGNESNAVASTEDNSSNVEQVNPLIPKFIVIEKLEANLLPFDYDTLEVKHLVLKGVDAVFDVQNLVLQKADLELRGSANLSDVVYKTKVKDNLFTGQVRFTPTKALFELYKLPVRKEAIGDIVIDLTASQEHVIADLNTKMKQLLKGEKDDFNLDIDSLVSHIIYDISQGTIKANSKVMLSTPYAKDILLTNLFSMDENISYSGEIHAKQIIGIDAKFVKPLNNLQLKYEGDTQSIKTSIVSDDLQGTFISSDFKEAALHLESKEAIALNEFIELPAELNQTKANVVIDAPIRFDENVSLVAYAKINSNVLNMDANISYEKALQIKTISYVPEESLLRTYINELEWDSLNPIRADAKLIGDGVDVTLNAGTLSAKAHYVLESTKVDGKITLGGLHADISGIAEQKFSIRTQISSMQSLVESLKGIYTFADVPVVKGSTDISLEINELKTVDMTLKSPAIMYHPDHKTEHIVNDIDLEISMEDSKVILKRYTLTYATKKYFSTKPSMVSFIDGNVSIAPFWLNDQLEIVGDYNTKTKKGTIDAGGKNVHIAHEMVEFDSDVAIKTVLDGNKTSVNGEVIILGGTIDYDVNQKSFASDSDIIIVQDIKEEKDTPFTDNLSVSIHIKTKTPLILKQGSIDIKAIIDLIVYKAELGDLMLLGTVEIPEGGSYTFEGKKFVLNKSYIYFTGNPNKPMIDASVNYRSAKHLITIKATGAADVPNIKFSSKPSLTKEQILSVILFGSEGVGGTNSGDDMMKMMGGVMAKSVLSEVGLEFDSLSIGEGNSLEVGKKLTERIMVIFNTVLSQLKVRYRHSKHIESVISVGAESQSYDIMYRKEF